MDPFTRAVIEEVRQGMREGGIPIGSVIVPAGLILSRGHNRRVQNGSAILLCGVPRVVIGENLTFMGEEALLRSHGVEVLVLPDEECETMMRDFIATHPQLWNEDIGET